MRPDVEHAGDEVVFGGGHAHDRRQADAAASRDDPLQRLQADAGVLHVEEQELGTRRLHELRQGGHEEFEDHRAEYAFARQYTLFQVGRHVLLLSTLGSDSLRLCDLRHGCERDRLAFEPWPREPVEHLEVGRFEVRLEHRFVGIDFLQVNARCGRGCIQHIEAQAPRFGRHRRSRVHHI